MKRAFLAALSGLLYALAFPPCDLGLFAWVFALPLLWLIEGADGREALAYGFITGLVAWGGLVYWIVYVMDLYGGMSLATATLVFLPFLSYLALYFGIFALIAARLLPGRWSFLTIPGVWILLELVRSSALTGFPWALLGYSQHALTSLIQIAEFGGVYVISGLVMMGNVSLISLRQRDWRPVIVTAALVGVGLLWGQWRMDTLRLEGPPLVAGIAQANIAQEDKWLPEMVQPTIDTYTRLTREAIERGATLVVWPETACNFFLFRQWQPTRQIITLSADIPARLLAGSPAVDDGCYYNRAWLLDKGKLIGWYDKVHLVPFGEYLPLAKLIEPFFSRLTVGVSDFSRGKTLAPVGKLGILNCFESLMPDMARTLAQQGAAVLVNISNDAWFKTWATPEQLLRMTSFRAIETRRWLLRPVNHGISAVIDPQGRIVSSLGLLQEGVLVAEITRSEHLSFYTRHGNTLPWLWAALSVLAALTTLVRNAKAS